MADLLDGRWTAQVDGDFVVFIIGAQVRNPLRAARALPLLGQMRKMLADLERKQGTPDAVEGYLGHQLHGLGPIGVIVQYWRSFDDLERFARDPGDRHAKVWRAWFRAAQHKNRAVGIWHESFGVLAGRYEAVYENVTRIGLLRAGIPERIGQRSTARQRLRQTHRPETAPVPLPRSVDDADGSEEVDSKHSASDQVSAADG